MGRGRIGRVEVARAVACASKLVPASLVAEGK
jgi:hypothetical protein